MLKPAMVALLLASLPVLAAPTTRPTRTPSGSDTTGPQIPAQPVGPTKDALKYEKSTPEQDAKAIADAQKRAAETGDQLKIKFVEMQTPHFIIFTDWDPREYSFLKTNVENAYTAVSRQFEMSPKDNIFVGKLPIYMFVKRDDFYDFASKIDNFEPPKGLAGYCQSRTDGFSHMAMSKPDPSVSGGSKQQSEKLWGYVLTHEFTHAFVARYRSNHNMPRWLNEGVAEVVAYGQFPRPESRSMARLIASGNRDISTIFNDDKMPPFEMYPVMMTMTEALIKENPKKFLVFFNALKDGAEPETCLKDNYGVDYAGLETAWRKYMKSSH